PEARRNTLSPSRPVVAVPPCPAVRRNCSRALSEVCDDLKQNPRRRRKGRRQPRGVGSGNEKEAASFVEAMAVARRQRAKSLRLRAAISLSRLWTRQRKTHEARALTAEADAGFTEGLDTA